MAKIKAASVAYTPNGSLVIVDEYGRVWMKQSTNNQWAAVELPDETDLPGTGQHLAKQFIKAAHPENKY